MILRSPAELMRIGGLGLDKGHKSWRIYHKSNWILLSTPPTPPAPGIPIGIRLGAG